MTNSHRKTIDKLPDSPDLVRGRPSHSASSRRELEAREIGRKHGSVLAELARIAFTSTDPGMRLRALGMLAPYLYPQLKSVEVSGPDGEKLTIEVRRLPGGIPPEPLVTVAPPSTP